MKINKYILGAGALLCMMLPAASAQAQDVKLKCMEWNIKSFEYDDNSNAVYFEIAEAMEKIKAENPDIVCFNEFETATGRMSSVEKLTECAQSLGMFPFFVFSYNKDNGAYGNGILSKYPIVNSASVLLGMYTGRRPAFGGLGRHSGSDRLQTRRGEGAHRLHPPRRFRRRRDLLGSGQRGHRTRDRSGRCRKPPRADHGRYELRSQLQRNPRV